MRKIRYHVAASLDGYIAGPKGEFDWIVADPDIDFRAIFAHYDTLLMGRGTYQLVVDQGQTGMLAGTEVVVFSDTLRPADHPQATIVRSRGWKRKVEALRAKPGKDLWLFGGGLLFRSFLDAGLVDSVEIAVIPVLVGGGIPLLAPPAGRAPLKLTSHRLYPKSGIVFLSYEVVRPKKARRRRTAAKARPTAARR
jgi:dihydrofolate reductase